MNKDTKQNYDESFIKELDQSKLSRGWFQKFKKRHRITNRKINTKVKKSFEELQKIVKRYFEEVSELFQENDNIVFVNYDEIGVFFEISQDKTLEVEGTNHVKLRSSGSYKKRLTLIHTVCSDGQVLPPIFMIKSCSKVNQNDDKYGHTLLDPYTRTMLKERRSLLLVNEKAGAILNAC